MDDKSIYKSIYNLTYPALAQFIFECDSCSGLSATVDALKADAEYFKVVSKWVQSSIFSLT